MMTLVGRSLPALVAFVALAAAAPLYASSQAKPAAAQPPAAQPAPASPTPDMPDYVLQRGDEVTIKVFNQPELLENVVIRPDGRISVILLDDIEAAGLTVPELDARVTTGYRKFFKEPQVSVIVRTFTNHRIFVGGEVGAPGPVPIVGPLRALEAILQVGGFRPSARLDSVILMRNDGNNRPLVQKINFKDTLKSGNDLLLKPYDVLFVPESRIAKVDKFVDNFIRQLIPISLTGGFTYVLGDRVAILR
jgi:protein involved in polysaccharide export with SLBB domain